MTGESAQLPWDQLQDTEDRIPWPALYAFADSVVTDPGLVPELFEVYDRAYEGAPDHPTRADFYVAAVFALAAPRLNDEQRSAIGALLVDRLVQAGRDDADVSLEVMLAAAGTMGPVIVPAVLEAIAKEPDTYGAWLFLWDLTVLAAQSEDEALRSRVIQACVDLLEKVERGEADPSDGINAAWTLAAFRRSEHEDLLRRLCAKPMKQWWAADYREALELLQSQAERTDLRELWEHPVEEWLTSRCRLADEAAAESDTPEEETEEEDSDKNNARLVATGFVQSPVASTLPEDLRERAFFIAERLLYFAVSELDSPPGRWDESVLRELLLDIVPRRMLAARDVLEKVIPVTEALLCWLRFEGILPGADALAQTIHGWADQVVTAGMDQRHWGAAKTMVMKALDTGLDFTKPQVRRALVDQTVAELCEPLPSPPVELPIPIVERSAKPARNAPCPCGSGQKYKKCHGRPGAERTPSP